jgi:putative ABC transport system permease protein
LILLRLISWQYARKHRLRWLLTTLGILLGVSIFVGMHAAGGAVLRALTETVDRIAGKTQLQVSAGEAGFPEEILEQIQSAAGVEVAVPAIEAVVQPALPDEGSLLILAVDMTGDRSLREYDLDSGEQDVVEDPLVFLAQPDSLIVTKEFAQRNGLNVNSSFSMPTMDGEKRFTIRGVMSSGGLGGAFGGNLAIMDIYAAQHVFGRGRRFDRIDLKLKEGYALEQGQSELRQILGPGYEVNVPAARGQQFESLLRIYSLTVDITSLFALFIGMFIIYNALSIAVTQRRNEIGILRALGATRGQVLSLFLIESAIAGLIGSTVGVLAGMAIATVMTGYVGDILQALYGVVARPEAVTLSGPLVLGAIALGIVTSIVAAIVPARNAARVDPVRALRKGGHQVLSVAQGRARQLGSLLFALIAVGCAMFGTSREFFLPGYLSFLVAVLLLTPTLSLGLTKLLRPLLKKVFPVEGALAADSLIHAPRRTFPTVAALMFSVGLIVSLGGISQSSYDSVSDWLITALDPDLFISASENLVERSFQFPDSLTPELEAVNGVEEVQRMRMSRVRLGDESALLIAMEMEKLQSRTRGRSVVAGDFDRMHSLTAEGKGAIVSETFSLLRHVGVNDMLEIPSPSGFLRLPIVGILRDYTYQSGSVFIDYSVYLRYWNDPSVDIYQIYLRPGHSPADVKQRVLAAFGKSHRLFVFYSDEVRARVIKNTEQWLGVIYIQIAMAVLVAILGITTTLSVSIVDRRREFAILRAVGGLSSQIRRAVWLEAVVIAVIGIVLGIAFGTLDLFYELELVRRYYAGMTLDYRFPVSLVVGLGPIIILSGVVSALVPAASAVRSSLVEGLEYE